MVASVGSVGKSRLALPRLFVEAEPGDTTDAAMHRRTLQEAKKTLTEHEVLIVDAGFSLADLLLLQDTDFVWRAPKNFTAQRDQAPEYQGRGRPPIYGEVVRPLAHTYNKKELAATAPDQRARWKDGKPGDRGFRCVVILDPRYKDPLVLVTVLPVLVTAHTLWCLYRDRWPIEQLPLAAKAMLGADRSFVFHPDSMIYRKQKWIILFVFHGNFRSLFVLVGVIMFLPCRWAERP